MRVLVTGGSGFIGANLVRKLLQETNACVINLDKLTYASDRDSVAYPSYGARYIFEHGDICDYEFVEQVFKKHAPTAIMHLAAESHVDNSIHNPHAFMDANIIGTYNLLEVAKHYYKELPHREKSRFVFHHISTDEVYGDLDKQDPPFKEVNPYMPSSPYSASKAASDHFVRAWGRTFGLPYNITNCSNNYGPYQHGEKFIPTVIKNALAGRSIPIYGDGKQIRDWLFVEDHVTALITVMIDGERGQTYNIGGSCEKTNLAVVDLVCSTLNHIRPITNTCKELGIVKSYSELIEFVVDRPGHDRRYAIDSSKIAKDLGWKPLVAIEQGMKVTVAWYLNKFSENGN